MHWWKFIDICRQYIGYLSREKISIISEISIYRPTLNHYLHWQTGGLRWNAMMMWNTHQVGMEMFENHYTSRRLGMLIKTAKCAFSILQVGVWGQPHIMTPLPALYCCAVCARQLHWSKHCVTTWTSTWTSYFIRGRIHLVFTRGAPIRKFLTNTDSDV